MKVTTSISDSATLLSAMIHVLISASDLAISPSKILNVANDPSQHQSTMINVANVPTSATKNMVELP